MRRIVAGISMIGFLTAVIGVPMPVSNGPAVAATHSHEDYPCRDHACGCLNAEMCRTQCCCGHRAKPAAVEAEGGGCCSAGDGATCSKDEKPAAKGVGFAINALGCRGVRLSWVSCGVVMSRPDVLVALAAPNAVDEVRLQTLVFPDSRSLKPSIPPPRA